MKCFTQLSASNCLVASDLSPEKNFAFVSQFCCTQQNST
jgi:hypothetical protein